MGKMTEMTGHVPSVRRVHARSNRAQIGICRASRRDLLIAAPAAGVILPPVASAEPSSIYDFSVKQYGETVDMLKYKGQVVVIVNVASE